MLTGLAWREVLFPGELLIYALVRFFQRCFAALRFHQGFVQIQQDTGNNNESRITLGKIC